MRASRTSCARCRRIATSWTTLWPRSSAPPGWMRASGCTAPHPTPGPSPRRDDRGARPRQGLRRGPRAGRPRPRCGRGRVFWLPRTERRRQDHHRPHPRHAAATHAWERPHRGARRGAREPRGAEEHRAGVSGAHARPRPHGGGEPPLRRAVVGPPGGDALRRDTDRRAAAAVRAVGAPRLAGALPLGRHAPRGRHRARCAAPAARPVPRRADGGARSPGAAHAVAVHPGPARRLGGDGVPDDALRRGGGAVRPRSRARSWSPRRPGDTRRAEARGRGGGARGGGFCAPPAPVPRGAIALGKVLGATLLGTVQALAVALILLPAARLSVTPGGAVLALAAVVLTSLAAGAVGLVLAATIRSIENFAGVMNFAIFPMLFLCGAFYPVRNLAAPLRALAYLNPLAYGVDLLKHALLAPWSAAGYGGELAGGFDFAGPARFPGPGLAAAAPLPARQGRLTRR